MQSIHLQNLSALDTVSPERTDIIIDSYLQIAVMGYALNLPTICMKHCYAMVLSCGFRRFLSGFLIHELSQCLKATSSTLTDTQLRTFMLNLTPSRKSIKRGVKTRHSFYIILPIKNDATHNWHSCGLSFLPVRPHRN